MILPSPPENDSESCIVILVNGPDNIRVKLFQLANFGDHENNIGFCIDESGIPILGEVNEGIAIDPNGDPNPATFLEVVSRW